MAAVPWRDVMKCLLLQGRDALLWSFDDKVFIAPANFLRQAAARFFLSATKANLTVLSRGYDVYAGAGLGRAIAVRSKLFMCAYATTPGSEHASIRGSCFV